MGREVQYAGEALRVKQSTQQGGVRQISDDQRTGCHSIGMAGGQVVQNDYPIAGIGCEPSHM